jgi:hypothetical protein
LIVEAVEKKEEGNLGKRWCFSFPVGGKKDAIREFEQRAVQGDSSWEKKKTKTEQDYDGRRGAKTKYRVLSDRDY